MLSLGKKPAIVRHKSLKTKVINTLTRTGIGLFLVLICFGVFSYTRAGVYTRTRGVASAAVSSTLNFQARLLNSSGNMVSDGSYNIEFKLFNASTSSGSSQGSCVGDSNCVWTETRTGANTVTVTNGYFSVNLGSLTAFASVNWDQEHWLTMNIGGTGAPTWDGEMTPRIKLTAVPYAFRAGAVMGATGAFTADDLLQKAPTSIQSLSSANAGLRFNQTGAGGLIQLQGDGVDVFTVTKTGAAVLAGASLSIGGSSQSGALILNDGSSNTGTLQLASLAQNTIYTLPDPGSGSTTICVSSGNCAGFGDINNGGNSFGGNITIGTNDTFGLNLETNGATVVSISSGGLVSIAGGTTITSGGLSVSGGIDNNSGGITEAGSITGVGANIIATAGLTIASGGAGGLTLDSATNTLVIAADDSTLQRTAAGIFTLDFADAGTTTLTLTNSGAGVSNLNLSDGGLVVGGTSVITNSLAIQNLTGLTVASGGSNITGGLTAVGSISLNNNDNSATSINTGTSSGTITLGGGSAPLIINSTNFDVTSGGAISGITGFTQESGNFVINGSGTFDTGTGLVALNGNTSIASGKTFAVAGVSTIAPTGNSEVALTITGTTGGTAANALVVNQAGQSSNLVISNTGATSSALINISHSTSAFTGTGLIMNVANGSGSFASGNFLDFQINNASRFRIDNTGALEIRSGSTAGLVIKDAAGTNRIFTVNVSGNSVFIGNSATDGTGVIFVFDNKNTDGDPAGQEGATYYNSARGTFRCYENSRAWTDCIGSPKPNTHRVTNLMYPGSGTTFSLLGDVSTAGTAPTAIAATATEPASLNFATGAVAGNVNHHSGNTNYSTTSDISYQTYISLPATTTVRVWAGVTNQTAATMSGSANPAGRYAAFRYDTGAGDANWKCVTKDNVTQNVVDSGIAIATTGFRLEVILTTASATFKINGVEVCTTANNLPGAGVLFRYTNSVTTLAAVARNIRVSWVNIENY